MKFIEDPKLLGLTNVLTDLKIGDRILTGRLEAFSCKRGGGEKRLCTQLDQQMREMGASPQFYSASPSVGDLSQSTVRRLLIDLICTMNASFPDYDFSAMSPKQFERETGGVAAAMAAVNRHLAEVSEANRAPSAWLAHLWAAVEEQIHFKDCDVYSYVPDMQDDPFSDGCLWSFNYFFYNKNLKRILYFTCVAKSRFRAADGHSRSIDEEDDEDLDNMGFFPADDK